MVFSSCKLFLFVVLCFVELLFCGCEEHSGIYVPLKLSRVQPLVVGGHPVDIDHYPCACVILNMNRVCGGSILNSWTVLTAAHCFDHNDDLHERILVYVGSNNYYGTGHENDTYYITRLIIHPDYDSQLFTNDIALIFVDKSISFSKRVQKAIIVNTDAWLNENIHRNKSVFTVIGWGVVKYKGPMSELGLQTARMKLVSLEKCTRLHAGKNAMFSAGMFCLYGDGKRDACQGDSGTGVFWNRKVVGIVSHGDGCAVENSPSVYTNVYYYRDWIETNIKDHFNKYCSNTDSMT